MRTEAILFLDQLKNLSEGLCFPSETDETLSPFFWEISDELAFNFTNELKRQVLQNPDKFSISQKTEISGGKVTQIEQIDVFMERVTQDKDWHSTTKLEENKRFRQLLEFMSNELEDLKLYQVGEGVEKEVYFVGIFALGGLAGFHTKIIQS